MADFPSLRPATVQITPGVVPATLQAGYDGSTTTSTADLVATGDALLLTFEGVTEAQARSVPDHQRSQRGKSFVFNSITLATALTPAGFQWTYARPVEQDDVQAIANGEFYRLTVAFVGVWIRRASTPSAFTRIEIRTTAAKALPAGTPSASTTLQLTTTPAGMATGTPSQSTFLFLKTTPANIISTPLNDSLYGSVALHLPLNSASGFVDVSGRSTSVTLQGGVSIDTSIGRWGNGSALFDGNGDWLAATLADAIGTGDYTIRFWIYFLGSTSNSGIYNFTDTSGGTNNNGPLHASIFQSIVTWNSSADFGNTSSINVWYFFQQTRTGNAVRTTLSTQGQPTHIIDQTLTTNITQTSLDIGIYFSPAYTLHGRINDFQVSMAARPHVVPTGPLPIF